MGWRQFTEQRFVPILYQRWSFEFWFSYSSSLSFNRNCFRRILSCFKIDVNKTERPMALLAKRFNIGFLWPQSIPSATLCVFNAHARAKKQHFWSNNVFMFIWPQYFPSGIFSFTDVGLRKVCTMSSSILSLIMTLSFRWTTTSDVSCFVTEMGFVQKPHKEQCNHCLNKSKLNSFDPNTLRQIHSA